MFETKYCLWKAVNRRKSDNQILPVATIISLHLDTRGLTSRMLSAALDFLLIGCSIIHGIHTASLIYKRQLWLAVADLWTSDCELSRCALPSIAQYDCYGVSRWESAISNVQFIRSGASFWRHCLSHLQQISQDSINANTQICHSSAPWSYLSGPGRYLDAAVEF